MKSLIIERANKRWLEGKKKKPSKNHFWKKVFVSKGITEKSSSNLLK